MQIYVTLKTDSDGNHVLDLFDVSIWCFNELRHIAMLRISASFLQHLGLKDVILRNRNSFSRF